MASRYRTLFPVLIAAGLVVVACGSASTPTAPVGAASPAVTLPATQGVVTDGTVSTQGADAIPSADASATGTSDDANRTVNLKMSFRVVNLYTTPGASTGPALDVWIGRKTGAGKKLVSVPDGQVSAEIPGQMLDPYGEGVPADGGRLDLSFYAAGADADPVFTQAEDAQDGLALTFVVTTSPDGGAGATGRVFADSIGTAPTSGGFSTPTVPTATSGNAVLLIDALALGTGKAGEDSPGLLASTADGTCLPYFDADPAGIGLSDHLHDMNSDVIDMIGGTSYRVFPVKPGAKVQIHLYNQSEQIAANCRATPMLTVDPRLTAGQRAYALLYGPSPTKAKVLLVPVG